MAHLRLATLRRLILLNINFRVDLFSRIQFCRVFSGFTFVDKEIYISLPGLIFTVARYIMWMMIAVNQRYFAKLLKNY